MIKDTLSRAEVYYNISEGIKKGFEWLKTQDFKKLPDGKYFIEEDKIYANIQTYLTKETAPFEAHRKYIDIQYMISGCEKIGVSDISSCSSKIPYDAEKDIEFLDCNTTGSFQDLNESEFLLLFPHDAHQPSLSQTEPANVKKVVVKVRI